MLGPSPSLDSERSIAPSSTQSTPRSFAEPTTVEASPAERSRPAWPESRLEGAPAKRLLLAVLTAAEARLDRIEDYTATLLKQERIGGTLGPEETIAIKVRHLPFAVHLKFLGHKAGQEVLYAAGKNENKLVVQAGGWSRRLVPRLTLDPTGFLAMAENRHPITEAGLAHLTGKLAAACRLDLDDPDAVTVLDRITEAGRAWLRSTHVYSVRNADRPSCRVEVCYDLDSGLPLRFSGYDWPKPGQADVPLLGESYRYDDLRLEAGLTDLDFKIGNPAYALN